MAIGNLAKRRLLNVSAIVMGGWLFFSPFALHYSDQGGVAAWNVMVTGLAMVVAATARLIDPGVVPQWVNVVVGVWLVSSPWFLHFDLGAERAAIENQSIVGALLVLEGLLAVRELRRAREQGYGLEDTPQTRGG